MGEKKIRVAFTGGGTGGHIYPGIAVADALKKKCVENGLNVEIYWIGCSSGMDSKIIGANMALGENRCIDKFYGIPAGKLRRYFSLKNFFDIFKIGFGFIASFFILLFHRPEFIFSKGGFVSVTPCLASKLLGIKVYTHECDFTPGLATRINSRSACKILLSYEETRDFFSTKNKAKTFVTGNPVRPVFYEADAKTGEKFLGIEKHNKPVLLVMGGSLGARQINEMIYESLEWLCERFIVVHQTGEKNEQLDLSDKSDAVKKDYHPYSFIYEEMPHVIAASDVVVSRSGANSLWECAVLEKPMVLIPLCGSGTRGDQVDNAEYFARKGCAGVLKGEHANSRELMNSLEGLLTASQREPYASSCRILTGKSRPVEIIASLLFDENLSVKVQGE